jgi:hypothetical protein
LAVITVIAAAGMAISLAVQGFFDRPAPSDDELLAKEAGLTQYRLQGAVKDGSLSDKEIERAVGNDPWSVERGSTAIRIVVAYPHTDTEKACYRFTLAQPLDPSGDVDRERLDRCPGDLVAGEAERRLEQRQIERVVVGPDAPARREAAAVLFTAGQAFDQGQGGVGLAPGPVGNGRADTLVCGEDGLRICWEVQSSSAAAHGPRSVRARASHAARHGITPAWHTDRADYADRRDTHWTRSDRLPARVIAKTGALRVVSGFRALGL